MPAPIWRSVVRSPVRSGLVITPARITSEPGTISAATSGKGGRGRIGGNLHRCRLEFRLAGQHDAAAVLALRRGAHAGAEMDEHSLGMVARRLLSTTVVSPGAARPASRTADLSCAEATGGW